MSVLFSVILLSPLWISFSFGLLSSVLSLISISVFISISIYLCAASCRVCISSMSLWFPHTFSSAMSLFAPFLCFSLMLLFIEPIPLLSLKLFLIMVIIWYALQPSRRSPGDTDCTCSHAILDLLLPSLVRSPLNSQQGLSLLSSTSRNSFLQIWLLSGIPGSVPPSLLPGYLKTASLDHRCLSVCGPYPLSEPGW